jgi:hypothetical protein
MTPRNNTSCRAEASCISSGYFSHKEVLFSKSVKRKVLGLEAMASFPQEYNFVQTYFPPLIEA